MNIERTFTQKVYEVVQKIPSGKVATYKQVAEMAGNSMASRAVGMAMKNNPDKSIIPCHRVVGSEGKMHGYAFGGVENKIQILKKEGIEFNNDRANLKKNLWTGA